MTDTLVHRRVIDDGDGFKLVAVQDVEEYLDFNKAAQNDGDGFTPSRDMKHVASIPLIFVEQWLNEEWERGNATFQFGSREWDALVKSKLNDPDWRWLRTAGGQV